MLWRNNEWYNPYSSECKIAYESGADTILGAVARKLMDGEGCDHNNEEAICFPCVLEIVQDYGG